MDVTQAVAAAQNLLSESPPGIPDAVLVGNPEDHEWCYVLQWTSRRAVQTRSLRDAPPPGIGPIAVDKSSGDAFYLSSVPLPVALDIAYSTRRRQP